MSQGQTGKGAKKPDTMTNVTASGSSPGEVGNPSFFGRGLSIKIQII